MKNRNHSREIRVLYDCAEACNTCVSACLEEDDVNMLVNCIKLDLDCADICLTVAKLLSRNSPHGEHLIHECIEVCKACAAECEKHAAMGMEHCRACADACKKCIQICQAISL